MTREEIWNRAKEIASREVVITGDIPWNWKTDNLWVYHQSEILEDREVPYYEGAVFKNVAEEDIIAFRDFVSGAEAKYIEKEKKLMEDKLMADWLVKNAYSADQAAELIKTIRRMCKEIEIATLYDKDMEGDNALPKYKEVER